MRSIRKKLDKIQENGKILFWCLMCLLLLTTSLYVYLVNTAAFNGVRWGRAQQEIAALGGSVSEFESRYLSLKQGVTLATAYASGFEDARNVTFISAQKVGAVAVANEI